MTAFKKIDTHEFVATEDLFLTANFPVTGEKTIVSAKDWRAGILLARKGTSIPERLAKQLGITETLDIAPTQLEPPKAAEKTVAPEEIESRETRPEKPAARR
jgi:hypothetical protein